jgi:hypothetical protein
MKNVVLINTFYHRGLTDYLLPGQIVCLLCVISQYQELQAGRGRISDIQAANTVNI